jgi:hypothetical protein
MSNPDTIGKIEAAIGSFKERRKKNNEDKLPEKKANMVGYFILSESVKKNIRWL